MLAQESARTHRHELIGTEHLLLGLLSEARGLAYEVLTAQSDSEQDIRASSDLGHDSVGTEHTLPGLIRAEESLAAQVLRNLGFTSQNLHHIVASEITNRLAASDT